MRISIFGLGYVGCVSAACLAARGHRIVGVDINQAKVELINEGRSPIVEAGVDDLIAAGVRAGRLRATADAREAVAASDLTFVCVGTPGSANGSLDAGHVRRVIAEIGRALQEKRGKHVVAVRSTVLPGTIETVIAPELEAASGRRIGETVGLAYNPEFLREGTAVSDFQRPPRTVVGAADRRAGAMLHCLYSDVDAPLVETDIRTAELVKYADNAFHALKVAFANEIGALGRASGVDGGRLMEIVCLDTKLNISPAYLRPGYAFGGSCLPKDLRALTHHGRAHDLALPLLDAILTSNDAHKRRGLEMVRAAGGRRVAVLGLSFKEGTDDLRESPTVELVETLLGKGYAIRIYDRNLLLQRLTGANKAYIEREIPHLASLLAPSIEEAVADAEVVVLATRDPEYARVPELLAGGQVVVDLVRAIDDPKGLGARYRGIGW